MFSDTIISGIFVLEPEIFDYIEPGRPVDFSGEVFPALLADGKPLYGKVADGYWEDVGNLESCVSAHANILEGKVDVAINGFEQDEHLFIGENVAVHPDAVITGPGVIGDNCRIEAGARIGPYSVLGANVRVRSDAGIERSVIADNAYIAEQVNIRGAVVGRACDLRAGVKVDEGAVIGDECFVGEGAAIGGGCEDLPVQDDRVRCGGEFFDRLGVEGLAEPLQSRGCLRPRQRRYHP